MRQRFQSERHDLSSNDDKKMQSIDLIETCIWNK